MNNDRYEKIARNLQYIGWFQDLVLRRARTHIVDVFRDTEATSVMDVGCGSGTLSKYLRSAGIDVTGVDSSSSMLSLARKKVGDVTLVQGDITEVSVDHKVDGSIIALALHEMSDEARSEAWAAMRRTTTEGGTLVLLDFTSIEKPAFFSRQVRNLIWKDEKNIGGFDPDHFRKFQEFMEGGGAREWLLKQGESILQEKRFLKGNLGVFVVKA